MKKFILILFLLPLTALSQQVIFCESVDRYGNPLNSGKEFFIGDDGGFFNVLVKLKNSVQVTNVIFDIYRVIEGKELFDNSIKMDVKPNLTWFYKEITFYKPGDYNVYVYSDRDKLLGVGKVLIKQK